MGVGGGVSNVNRGRKCWRNGGGRVLEGEIVLLLKLLRVV